MKNTELLEKTKLVTLRTSEYRGCLQRLYLGTIVLTDLKGHIGSRFHLEHYCKNCDSTFLSKPGRVLQGKGCSLCFTSSTAVATLVEYRKTLELVTKGRISLYDDGKAVVPRSGFALDRPYRHICNGCHAVTIHKPKDLLAGDPGQPCETCRLLLRSGDRALAYRDRLIDLYSAVRVSLQDKFSTRAALTHLCGLHKVSWAATVAEMLQGRAPKEACPCVTTPPKMLTLGEVVYYRITYTLRTSSEMTALPKVVELIPVDALRTALEYPIPVIYFGPRGTYVPGFMDHRNKLLVSAVTRADFKNNRSKWVGVCDAAKDAGYALRLIIANPRSGRLILLKRDWYQRDPKFIQIVHPRKI